MAIFIMTVQHDKGKSTIRVISYSGTIQEAITRLCKTERCPESAVLSITRVK